MAFVSVSFVLSSTAPAPVTLIGGFLGAGKTTAVRSLLENRRGLKVAVLVNDFAAVNIDAAILRQSCSNEDGVETVELTNGCVCCGAGTVGLADTIRSLRSRTFDHIVVELSGVADPEPVLSNLQRDGIPAARTVTLVDVNAFLRDFHSTDAILNRPEILKQMYESRAALAVDSAVVELLLQQVLSANLVLVNKCDLASDDTIHEVAALCRALNSGADVRSTRFGAIDLDVMLPHTAQEYCQQFRPTKGAIGLSPRDTADTLFSSFVYTTDRPFACYRLAELINVWPLAWREVEPALKTVGLTRVQHIAARLRQLCYDIDSLLYQVTRWGTSAESSATAMSQWQSLRKERTSLLSELCDSDTELFAQTLAELQETHDIPMSDLPQGVKLQGGQAVMQSLNDEYTAGSAEAGFVNRCPQTFATLRDGLERAEGHTHATAAAVTSAFQRVLRSKGVAFLDCFGKQPVTWSHAGEHLRIELEQPKLASGQELPPLNDITQGAATLRIRSAANDVDQLRQEIVFIGTAPLPEDSIRAVLDACLVTKEEWQK